MATKLPPAEWKVMEVLWQKPHTLMQLVSALEASDAWSKSTVTTLVRRLMEKNLIGFELDGRTKNFFPKLRREQIVAEQTETLLQKAYYGSVGSMVSAMVERADLTQEDIDELYAILRKAEEGLK